MTEICELEELKKNTGVTNSILATARNRLANDDSQKVVKLLIDKLQKSYSEHVGFSREMQTCCSYMESQERRTVSLQLRLCSDTELQLKMDEEEQMV